MSEQAKIASIRRKFRALHSEWLRANHRSDMNKQMDSMARTLGLDPITLKVKKAKAAR